MDIKLGCGHTEKVSRQLLVALAAALSCLVILLGFLAFAFARVSRGIEEETGYLRLTIPSPISASSTDDPHTEVFRVSYDDSGQDPNAASDSTGQSGLLTIRTVARSEIQFELIGTKLPQNKTYYLFLDVFEDVPSINSGELVKVGNLEVGPDGRGTISGTISKQPGKYIVRGVLLGKDDGAPPYTDQVYFCLPSVAVTVS